MNSKRRRPRPLEIQSICLALPQNPFMIGSTGARQHLVCLRILAVMLLFMVVSISVHAHEVKSDAMKAPTSDIEHKPSLFYEIEDRLFNEVDVYLQYRDEIGLTNEQFAQLINIKTEAKKEIILQSAKYHQMDASIHAELDRSEMDPQKIRSLLKAKNSEQLVYLEKVLSFYTQVRQTIRPEQRQKLEHIRQ